jgi:hypothetical protein
MSTTSHSGRACASCEHFPLDASMATGGAAQCAIYERPTTWDTKFCVLHHPAPDVRERRALAEKLSKQPKGEPQDGQASP